MGYLLIPAGSPLWARSAVIADYGGHTSKANELDFPARQLRTDFDAAMVMRLADHLVSVSRTADLGVLVYTNNDTAATDPTVLAAYLAPGVDKDGWTVGSEPPTGMPSLVRAAAGRVTVTFASTYADAYDVDGAWALWNMSAQVLNTGNYKATLVRTSATVVDVYCYNTATGAAATDLTVALWLG